MKVTFASGEYATGFIVVQVSSFPVFLTWEALRMESKNQ